MSRTDATAYTMMEWDESILSGQRARKESNAEVTTPCCETEGLLTPLTWRERLSHLDIC